MLKRTLILAACVSLSGQTWASHDDKGHAEPWSNASLAKTIQAMPKGNIEKGQQIHSQMMCNACHGEFGESPSRNYASLNGQTPEYTIKMMLDYKEGRRWEDYKQANIMVKIARAMSDQDIADVAAFYAANPATQWEVAPLDAETFAKTDRLVRKGDVSRMITPCASCHGAHGEGNEITPAIAGQVPEYFVRTMKAYQGHHRSNDVNQGMSQFTHDLSDAEIDALANYYANMGQSLAKGEQ